MGNPYEAKPAHAFWRRAVAQIPPFALDPVVAPPFTIGPADTIATAGSCFAQHISRSLQSQGMRYLVAEAAPAGMAEEQAHANNYGTFSARYGNLYTTRQLVQLFDRAHGAFMPEVPAWRAAGGGVLDPFRPQIQPGGFATEAEMLADRERHLAAVRAMFATLTVFIFTLGLTEGWRHEASGAVVPLAPGVADDGGSRGEFSFVNFGFVDTHADILAFAERLRGVNRAARIILTVSPVPLIATFEDRHVLTSTVYSKSVLHAACIEAQARAPGLAYFPSFEIVTAPINRDRYFEADLRSVNQIGVEHVMRVFQRHFVAGGAGEPAGQALHLSREIDASRHIICDEEILDR